ncbi:unnamed protein product, partial [Allacma fusca]
RFTGSL